MIEAIHHSAISVSNMEKSLRFYRDLLGMEVEWDMDHRSGEALSRVVGMKDVDVHIVMLRGWGSRIELFQYHHPKGRPYPEDRPLCDNGITHIAFQVRDIEGEYQRLLERGVKFNSPPQELRPGVKATYLKDPDGITIEFIEYE